MSILRWRTEGMSCDVVRRPEDFVFFCLLFNAGCSMRGRLVVEL
jgi:hypothetical protein